MGDRLTLTRGEERKYYVKRMFNSIAHRYDLLNHLLSFGLDIIWRKRAISKLDKHKTYRHILDLACGTGDFAIEISSRLKTYVVGADLALRMLAFGKKKINQKHLSLVNADGELLPFHDQTFDAVTIAFGIRNMGHIDTALTEMYRILSESGQAVILEFSLPEFKAFRVLYLFYFNRVLPLIGRLISGHQQAYTYLPVSVDAFPTISSFKDMLKQAGFYNIEVWEQFFGVAVIYKAIRPAVNIADKKNGPGTGAIE